MQALVEITLHGNTWADMPKQNWKLAVKSVAESMHALNTMTRNKFYAKLLENDKKNIKYEILINKNPCLFAEPPDINKPESLLSSELVANYPNLKTIDIVPVIEGADADIGLVIAGIALIVIGAFTFGSTAFAGAALLKGALVIGGIGLVAAGIINLLSTPPKLDDFQSAVRKGSYLFDGPENAVGEGGPVPLVYGQLLVGSQTIEVTVDNADQKSDDLSAVGSGGVGGGLGGGTNINVKRE